MNRRLAFILLIIVAVAAFTPCCSVDDCQDDPVPTSQQDHRKSDDGGGCSPFFACTGCLGFTLSEKTITAPVPDEYHPQYFIVDSGFISSAYDNAPWQPPRTI